MKCRQYQTSRLYRQGQLGLGTSVSEYYEPQRVGTENNWKSVSAGSHHTMAIKNNGTLWGWGENREGQLGDGTRISKNIPTFIDINWTMVEANAMNTLAIDDGVIWKWGNFYSQFDILMNYIVLHIFDVLGDKCYFLCSL